MDEYTLNFKEGIKVGLRSSEYNPRNTGALVEAWGVIQESGKLFQQLEFDTFDISGLDAQAFPFPQIFQGINWTIVCTPTKIYTYDGSTLTLVYTAEEGSTWTLADYHNFLVLSNGKELVTLDPMTGDWSKFITCEVPSCLCLCNINGQLFVGGPECSISAGWLGD